ncbi:MAG: hypothetical protein Q9168_004138 [Polycauliona sp. 1 TL-2023]
MNSARNNSDIQEYELRRSTRNRKPTRRADNPQIPRYTINLSLPPADRYKHLAPDFLPHITSLTTLFDEVVPRPIFRTLASHLLRRLHSAEQTAELRGIHRITGIGMHLLIAFNVLLDLMMGCTSGGVRVHEGDRMLHFRTLDWGMDPLRKIIVHLDYIRDGEGVVASVVTYVGYVGVLTGVARGLSVSLNFRPVHNARSWWEQVRFYAHHALVLFGLRPSISEVLRGVLMPVDGGPVMGLEELERKVRGMASTAAYLVFCDGQRTLTMEKDYGSAIVNSASDFIVVTNHDRAQELAPNDSSPAGDEPKGNAALQGVFEDMSMNAIVAESSARKQCLVRMWEKESTKATRTDKSALVKTQKVAKWVDTYPITDALTHYAVIMDPSKGVFTWERYYPDAKALWDRLNGRHGL